MHGLRRGHLWHWHARGHLCSELCCLRPGQVQRCWEQRLPSLQRRNNVRCGLLRGLRQLPRWLLLPCAGRGLHALRQGDLCQQQRERMRALPRGQGSACRWQRLLPPGLQRLARQLQPCRRRLLLRARQECP